MKKTLLALAAVLALTACSQPANLDNNNTGDTPIAGVTIVLKDAMGNPVATTTTDVNGNYIFINVPAGSYTVEQLNSLIHPDVGDSDGGNPNVISVTVQPGQTTIVPALR